MSSHRRRAGLALLLALVIVFQPLLPVWSATPPPAGPNIGVLVRKFQATAAGPVQCNAVREIFPNYGAYKNLVATGKVAALTARVVDEVLVTWCQETWRDVAVHQRMGLEYVVPVGTLGDRWGNKNYIPGKSDKDFIPRGPQASQAAADFEKYSNPATGVLTIVCAEGVVVRIE